MDMKSIRFICEAVDVAFEEDPALTKRPGCADRFVWRGEMHQVAERLKEWHDYGRRGRMAHNMRAAHLEAARRRGSWGVGRDYFRVRTKEGRIFDLYYDRAPKGTGGRGGAWFLYRELGEGEGGQGG